MIPENNTTNCHLIIYQDGDELQRSIYHSINEQEQHQPSSINELLTSKKLSTSDLQINQDVKLPPQAFTNGLKRKLSKQMNEANKFFQQYIVFSHINKFAKSLLSTIRPDPSFSKLHHSLIGDKASSFKNQIRTNSLNKKVLQYEHLLNVGLRLKMKMSNLIITLQQTALKFYMALPLIDPTSHFKSIWDFLLMLIRIYIILLIPIIIVFDNSIISYNSIVYLEVLETLLFFDILLRNFTISYEQGVPIKDKHKLAQKQLTRAILVETFILFLSMTIIYNLDYLGHQFVLGPNGWPKAFLLLQYQQINNILEFIEVYSQKIKPTRQINSIVELVKLLSMIILIQHFFCCMWVLVGEQAEKLNVVGWMSEIISKSWEYKYLESYYFMSVTMFSVGYGDITPQNPSEKIFCIFYMFLSTLQLSYSFNTIGAILTQLKESNYSVKNKLILINEYMKEKNISHQLQQKVREYCSYYLRPEIFEQRQEQNELIQMLPQFLQESLQIEAASVILEKIEFFKDHFSKDTMQEILKIAYFENYHPDVTIAKENEINLWVVQNGIVNVVQGKKLIKKYRTQEAVNFLEFLHGTVCQNFEYRTSEFTTMLKINRQKFVDIITRKPDEYETFLGLLQKEKYSKNCIICSNGKHNSCECNLIQFIPDREKVIKKYLFLQQCQRRYKNRQKQKLNSLSIIAEVQNAGEEFLLENSNYVNERLPDFFSSIDEIQHHEDEQILIQNQLDQSLELREAKNSSYDASQLKSESNFPQLRQALKRKQDNERVGKFATNDDYIKQLQIDHLKLENKLIQKLKRINKARDKLTASTQEEIEYWLLKFQNQIDPPGTLADFEKLKNYKKYSRRWNIKFVIQSIEESNTRFQEIQTAWNRFNPYIINIGNVIQKYYSNKVEKLKQKDDGSFFESTALSLNKIKRFPLARKKSNRRTIFPMEITLVQPQTGN